VNGKPLVYLDNAASTQKPRAVIDAIVRHYEHDNANVHRGIHELSNRATDAYDSARAAGGAFLGMEDPAELIWTRGTTEGLNLVAWAWGSANLKPGRRDPPLGDGAPLQPGPLAARRAAHRRKLRFLEMDDRGAAGPLRLDDLLTERTKLVSVAHVSNALGTVNPCARSPRAHAVGALMVVDGAQSAPHLPVDVPSLGADFYAFSGHKMCGPRDRRPVGTPRALEAMPPFHGGGDMIEWVELERSTYAPLPTKFEAGTPTSPAPWAWPPRPTSCRGGPRGDPGARAALWLRVERMSAIPDLTVLPRARATSASARASSPSPWATCTRTTWPPSWTARGSRSARGHHCCQPLMRCLGVGSTARASFYLYNTQIEGRSLDDARTLAGLFLRLMHGDADAARDRTLGDLRALAGVARFPVRVKCALLAWNALDEADKVLSSRSPEA
jgi:cysteine desulfurase / selenocysteine lyase